MTLSCCVIGTVYDQRVIYVFHLIAFLCFVSKQIHVATRYT
jgi:hypothetical protein